MREEKPFHHLCFHTPSSWFIKEPTLVSGWTIVRGEITFLLALTGSKLSYLFLIDCPFPILHTIPLRITSLALWILFQALDPTVESLASKIEQSGKNQALNTWWHREFGLFIMRHTCLARMESLNFSISLNPNPPTSLASHN